MPPGIGGICGIPPGNPIPHGGMKGGAAIIPRGNTVASLHQSCSHTMAEPKRCHRGPWAPALNMLANRGCVSDVEAVKERLARGYSQSAPRYDALAGHLYLTGIRRLLPRVRIAPGAAILDVGCGTGVNLLEAARWFAPTGKLCGIDISPGMVAVAQSKAGLLGLPAQFRVGDAERLPYSDAEFDLVICNSVLQWFDSLSRSADLEENLLDEHQLAGLLAGFEQVMGLHGRFEGQDPVHHRFDPAGADLLQGFKHVGGLARVAAQQTDLPPEQHPQIQLGVVTGGIAACDEAPARPGAGGTGDAGGAGG